MLKKILACILIVVAGVSELSAQQGDAGQGYWALEKMSIRNSEFKGNPPFRYKWWGQWGAIVTQDAYEGQRFVVGYGWKNPPDRLIPGQLVDIALTATVLRKNWGMGWMAGQAAYLGFQDAGGAEIKFWDAGSSKPDAETIITEKTKVGQEMGFVARQHVPGVDGKNPSRRMEIYIKFSSLGAEFIYAWVPPGAKPPQAPKPPAAVPAPAGEEGVKWTPPTLPGPAATNTSATPGPSTPTGTPVEKSPVPDSDGFFMDPLSGIMVRKIYLKERTQMQVFADSTFPIFWMRPGEVWISKDTRGSGSGRLVIRGAVDEPATLIRAADGKSVTVPAGSTIHVKGTNPGMGQLIQAHIADEARTTPGAGSSGKAAGPTGTGVEPGSGQSGGPAAPNANAGSADTSTEAGSLGPAAASRLTVQAGSRRAMVGQTVMIPVWLIRGSGVANMNISVNYNPAVARPQGEALQGNLIGSRTAFEVNTKLSKVVKLGLAGRGELEGADGTLAQIPFVVTGQPGDRTALSVTVTDIGLVNGSAPDVDTINGEIVVVGANEQISGDADGDGVLTAADALNALKMSVELIPVNLVCDLNKDGKVTSTDAKLILQKVVGK